MQAVETDYTAVLLNRRITEILKTILTRSSYISTTSYYCIVMKNVMPGNVNIDMFCGAYKGTLVSILFLLVVKQTAIN